MKSINNYFSMATMIAIVLFVQNSTAQDSARKAPTPPTIKVNVKPTSNMEINNFVTNCFEMYNTMMNLSQKTVTIENDIVAGNINSLSFENINETVNGFENIKHNGPALIASVANMISNIGSYHIKILEIPRTLANLREALKAIKYSIESSVYMLRTVADLKKKVMGTINVAGTNTN